ncbi:hypothetical protein B0H16DRAFT_1449651 [Mycena metata]|uniref:Uncharacterized protein n=1 Tax=Mycena metata TaxID=1033252 RepID=A0AAD7K3W4_9AGAR|nr:hypothetical protein B0H16DRAFT_1449651 [Mycena metata]
MAKSKKKICRCKRSCHKLLAKSTRRKHFKEQKLQFYDSDPESESIPSVSDSESMPSAEHEDLSAHSLNSASVSENGSQLNPNYPEDGSRLDLDSEISSDDSMDIDPPHPSAFSPSFHSDLDSDTDDMSGDNELISFDEVEDKDVPKSLVDMKRELDEMIHVDEERELWEIRELFIIPLARN